MPDTPPVTVEIAGEDRARVAGAISRIADKLRDYLRETPFAPSMARAGVVNEVVRLRALAARIAPEGASGRL